MYSTPTVNVFVIGKTELAKQVARYMHKGSGKVGVDRWVKLTMQGVLSWSQDRDLRTGRMEDRHSDMIVQLLTGIDC